MKSPNFFNRHLCHTGENFFEHFLFTFTVSLWMGISSIVLFLHAFFPFLFPFIASKNIKKIDEIMQKRIEDLKARNKNNSDIEGI